MLETKQKIRLLVITYLPWRDDNNIGNSYSNIFRNTEDKYELAHIYIRDGMPQNELVHEYYHISEKKLINRFWGKHEKIGQYIHIQDAKNMPQDQFSNLYNKARLLRWEIFFMIREWVGLGNSWKTLEFEKFLDRFKPDIVFGTLSAYPIITNIMCYVSKSRCIPLITYPWDDHYSFNKFSLSPFYWLHKIQGRYYQRKAAAQSEFLYVISDLMKHTYEKTFNKECKILYKGHDFRNTPVPALLPFNKPIHLIYMGNIGGGRWETLAFLAQSIKRINTRLNETSFKLDIYTLSPLDSKIRRALNIEGSSMLNSPVSNDMVDETLAQADILLHVEPLKEKDYCYYKASFSTKLVDYFYKRKTILSLGGITASTDYLKKNDATIYVDTNNLDDELMEICKNPQKLNEYADKAWDCGKRNHQISDIQNAMYKDFQNIVSK